jgi:predicted nuclease with TOPRIM domain
VSLQEELRSVKSTLSFLKNFTPHTKNAGRPRKNQGSSAEQEQSNFHRKVIKVLDSVHGSISKMCGRISILENENSSLKELVFQLSARVNNNKSYASAVAANVIEAPECIVGDAVPANLDMKGTQLSSLNCRLDNIEQESLSTVLICQGEAVTSLVERVKGKNILPKEQIIEIKDAIIN